ncbi:hypothetical protein E5P68_07265 [Helicobacter pylori]|nr:hypothetical protein E5P68_07265 [Helicobacter pylori]
MLFDSLFSINEQQKAKAWSDFFKELKKDMKEIYNKFGGNAEWTTFLTRFSNDLSRASNYAEFETLQSIYSKELEELQQTIATDKTQQQLLEQNNIQGHKMQKKKPKNPQPNLFSILDNGDIATNNPIEESGKANEIQVPLPYVVKTQINQASMINRNPIEWAKYLSFEKRIYKDNSKEDVNFFANGEIKESSRVYEANEEGFERRITKRYDLIDRNRDRNREFFIKEIEILTYTNS